MANERMPVCIQLEVKCLPGTHSATNYRVLFVIFNWFDWSIFVVKRS